MTRVLAIALDAADPALIERWIADGSLPHLQKLREDGAYGRLSSPAQWATGSCWPTFYTSQNPGQHGFYNYLVWRPNQMKTEAASPENLPLFPFWHCFTDPTGPRAIVIDTPLTYSVRPFNGRELFGFAVHDSLVSMTGYPPEFVEEVRRLYGGAKMFEERYGLQSRHEIRDTRDKLINITRQIGDLSQWQLTTNPWDYFMVSLTATHRAGHRLWSLQNVVDPMNTQEKAEFSDALRQVFIACDEVIGQLVKACGQDTVVLVFSLHGMGINHTRGPLLPEMLKRILTEKTAGDSKSMPFRLLNATRVLLPAELRHRVKSSLPVGMRHKLTAFWRTSGIDWSKTRAFSLVADCQGWIRINLKGRESQGIVNPGAEYETLCESIAAGLKTFRDADTGEPVVSNIVRSADVFKGKNIDSLPDLIIVWNETPVHQQRAIISSQFGSIHRETPGRNPEGRSGNHRSQGMLIATGKGIKSGNIEGADILDLAPTILSLLGAPIPAEMEGKPIPLE